MQKLVSILLILLLCLCALPIAAEESVSTADAPAVALPVSFERYQAAYEAVIAANAPDAAVSWREAEQNGRTIRMAVISDAFVSVMALLEEGNVTELAVAVQAGLDQDTLYSFLSMAGYSAAALLVDDDTDATAASIAAMNTVFDVFTAMTEGRAVDSILGLPGVISISAPDETSWQYYFSLKVVAE